VLPARISKDEPYNDCRNLAQGICSLAETFEALTALFVAVVSQRAC
jgi:hypothetical protein